MVEFLSRGVYFGVILSILGYALGVFIYKRLKLAFFHPIVVSTALVIATLSLLGIDYAAYNNGAKYISYFLTPTTVCLAIPLYRQIDALKKNLLAVVVSISAGVIAGLGSIALLSLVFGLSHEMYITLLPKSITTAIGLALSEELGGIPTITAAGIFITGIFGNTSAQAICKLFRIREPVAVGLAFGTSSHAIGTSRALSIGEVEGAMSSLAIVVTGLMTVVAASFFAGLA